MQVGRRRDRLFSFAGESRCPGPRLARGRCYRMSRLNVAIVAPSLRFLGGQAVQADRLVRSWKGDRDVNAWLTPVNPQPPRFLRWAVRVKYLRTVVTECTYAPLLLKDLARADLVHVFSASYSSFLLAP